MINTAFAGTELVSKQTLQKEREYRKKLIADKQYDNPAIRKLPAIEAINSITDSRMRAMVEESVIKAVGSTDITGHRFVSYHDQMYELANQQTVFTDIVEANGLVRSTDFQIRWNENYANTNAPVNFFNLNAGLPSEAEMSRAVFGNTMGAYGNLLNIRIIAQALGVQSMVPTDEQANQLRMQLIRMKRFSNQTLLSNTEISSEAIGDTPQYGGFVTRSSTNGTSYVNNFAVATDLTSPIIQTGVNAIANAASVQGLGFSVPLVALTTQAQIAKIRDLMIQRFPGEKSNSYTDYQAMLQRMLPGVALEPDMVQMYRANPGRVVAFIDEPQLAAGNTIMFVPSLPRIAQFQMLGQFGPWILERPTPELTYLVVVFDFKSLIDPLGATRYLWSGLN